MSTEAVFVLALIRLVELIMEERTAIYKAVKKRIQDQEKSEPGKGSDTSCLEIEKSARCSCKRAVDLCANAKSRRMGEPNLWLTELLP